MSKKNMIPEEQVRKKLNEIDHKVDLLVEGYEKKIARLEKTNEIILADNSKATKVKPVAMPTDIEVDVKDKLNTQPENSLTHNYIRNHRMFRKDIFKTVMQSKMFWILLVTLPLIMTFIEFTMTGWAVYHDAVFGSGLSKVATDLINWFMLMPMLLMSLIIFPTFIAVSRENNQLKRYTMMGMSRKQIYYSYIRFTFMFLLIFIFLWMGPWVLILNKASDAIWLTDDDLAAGNHVFNNPWGIFFGMPFNQLNYDNNFVIHNQVAFDAIQQAQIDLKAVDPSGTGDPEAVFKAKKLIIDDLQQTLKNNGIEFEFWKYQNAFDYVENATIHSNGIIGGEITSKSHFLRYTIPMEYTGMKTKEYFILFTLAVFGINSIGFNKAMKVKSSRSMLGWGIGLWIFTTVVQGTSELLYNDIYKFNEIDNAAWNYVVMILLLIPKWMFILSPVTIIMVGISLTTGLISEPSYNPDLLNNISLALDTLNKLMDTTTGFEGPIQNLIDILTKYKDSMYDPLIPPHIITNIFIGISGIWATGWTLHVWLHKSRIISYEAAR